MLLRVGLSILCAAAASSCAGRSECIKHGGAPWFEYRSDHFTLQSDADPETVEEVVGELERARRAMLHMWPHVESAARVDAVLMRSFSAYTEFAPEETLGVFYRAAEPLMVLSARSYLVTESPDVSIVYHELAHYFGAHGMLRQPRWIAEGTATFLETMQFDGDMVRIGVPSRDMTERTRAWGVLPLDSLWAWERASELTLAETAHRYSSSWAWVHFLMNRHEKRFRQFMAALGRAEDPRAAWRSTFGSEDEALRAELDDYFAGRRYSVKARMLPPRPLAIRRRELSPPEVHLLRARLHSLNGGIEPAERQRRAHHEHEVARTLEPESVAVAVAALRLDRSSPGAQASAEALATRFPDHAEVQSALAEVTFVAKQAPSALRIARIRRALELKPDDARLLDALALSLAAQGRGAEALQAAHRAVAQRPWVPQYVSTLAATQALAGRCAEAVASQRRSLEMLHESAPATIRARLQRRLSAWEAGCQEPLATLAAE